MSSSTVPNPYSVDGIITSSASPKCDFYDVPLSNIELSESPICTHLDEDETATAEFLAQLETNLLYLPFYEVYEHYHKSNSLVELKYCINEYFDHLQSCMIDPDCATYLDMDELESPYDQFDLASFGDTFWLLLFALYPEDGPGSEFRNYSTLIYHYLRLFPNDLASARTDLLRCFEKVKKASMRQQERSILVEAFRKPTQGNYSTLEDFVDGISLPTERTRLYKHLRTIFERYFVTNEDKSLLCLSPVGCDPSTGRSIDCTDVHFHLSISAISESVELDSSTMALLSKLVIRLFRLEFRLTGTYDCCDSGRWNVVEFDIGEIVHGHKGQYGSKLRICLDSTFSQIRRSFNFYVHSDPRFVPFTVLLKNWFHRGQLLNPTDQFDETFIWLIILFLQQTDPPVLPSMQQLDNSGAFDLDPSLELNEFFLKSINHQSIPSLINDFVQFYLHFDFDLQMFNRWEGTVCSKDQLESIESALAIDVPFDWGTVGTCYTVQDMEQWKIGLGKLEMLSKDGEIECEHLWNPRYFADSRSMSYQLESESDAELEAESEVESESEAPESVKPILKPSPQTPTPTNPFLMSTFDLKQVNSEIGSLRIAERDLKYAAPHVPSPSNRYEFSRDFIYTERAMLSILSAYDMNRLHEHITDITHYFAHLQARLQESNLSYSTLLESSTLANTDYCSYGPRFWQFLVECGYFCETILNSFSILICHYLEMIPKEVLNGRELIVKVHVNLIKKPRMEPGYLDNKVVAYKKVDRGLLHLKVRQLQNNKHHAQIEHILDQVFNPQQAKHFVLFIHKLFEHPKLRPLKPKLIQLGANQSGSLSIHSIDRWFHFYVVFESVDYGLKEDWSTSVLMLQLIGWMLKLRYNFDCDDALMPNRLTWRIQNYRLLIHTKNSVPVTFGILVSRMIRADQGRFGQVVTLLQYWAKCNGLRTTDEFVWLVIFALQNTDPPVLLPVECTPAPTISRQTIPELIVHFFKFYSNFDFANLVICPRDGHFYSNVNERTQQVFFNSNAALFEEPFNQKLIYLYSEPDGTNELDRFKDLCNQMLSVGKINRTNCLTVLTNPDIRNNDGLVKKLFSFLKN